METLKKILSTILILYTLAGKLYTTAFNFKLRGFDLSNVLFIHFTNITMLFMLLVSLLIVWGKWYNKINFITLKYMYTFKVLIALIVIIQLFVCLLDYFNKSPNVNHFKVLFIGDLPNLFSIIITIILIVALPNKKYYTKKQ